MLSFDHNISLPGSTSRSPQAYEQLETREAGVGTRRRRRVVPDVGQMKPQELAAYVSTSMIEADVTEKDVVDTMDAYPFASLAVDLHYIDLTKRLLEGRERRITTVSSYPLGGMTTNVKLKQVEYARDHGAYDIDVSMNYLWIKSGQFDRVEEEVRRLVSEAGPVVVVMIPQTAILTNEEKRQTCEALLAGGCRTIKTCSGFGWKTEVEDVSYIKRLFGDDIEIEVSGGVRTRDDTVRMLRAGAARLHTSTPMQALGVA
jgi:deoxyribose-phosphate aldolase